MTTADVKRMKVADLRAELVQRSLDVSGVRAVLAQRVEAVITL